jgi:hypothetical protein
MKWEPIETAPREGLVMLAVVSGHERRVYVAERSSSSSGDYWSTTTGWTGWGRLHSAWAPTHWMPLPPPPEGA